MSADTVSVGLVGLRWWDLRLARNFDGATCAGCCDGHACPPAELASRVLDAGRLSFVE